MSDLPLSPETELAVSALIDSLLVCKPAEKLIMTGGPGPEELMERFGHLGEMVGFFCLVLVSNPQHLHALLAEAERRKVLDSDHPPG